MFESLNAFVHLVNSTGSEIAITLVVGGKTISGMLTPNQRFASWAQEVAFRAVREKGKTSLPKVQMPPITNEQAKAVQAEWEQAEAEEKARHPEKEPSVVVYNHLCLRNARTFAPFAIMGRPPVATTYPISWSA